MANPLTVREYQPGEHTLVYTPIGASVAEIRTRCYRPDHAAPEYVWSRLGDEYIFVLDIDFDILGTWILVVREDGLTTLSLKAEVRP